MSGLSLKKGATENRHQHGIELGRLRAAKKGRKAVLVTGDVHRCNVVRHANEGSDLWEIESSGIGRHPGMADSADHGDATLELDCTNAGAGSVRLHRQDGAVRKTQAIAF